MKIKITTSCSGLNFSYSAGEIAEVKKDLGDELVAVGFAEEIKEVKPSVKKEAKPKAENKDGDENAVT